MEKLNKGDNGYGTKHPIQTGGFWAYSIKEAEINKRRPSSLPKAGYSVDSCQYGMVIAYKPASVEIDTIERQFNELATNWKKEIGGYSTMAHMALNNNYLDIIAIGPSVIPYILKDLQKTPGHWHIALKHLAKENPVPNSDLRKMEKIRQAWLAWGKDKGLIK